MPSSRKSIFAKRSLILCCVAGAVVIWLGCRLVDVHIIDADHVRQGPGGGRIDVEVSPARRGIIMDSQEEVLTTNVQSAELIGDRYHLRDPKIVTWGLAYSKAVHSGKWDQMNETARDKMLVNYRSRLLRQAASKEDGNQDYKLARVLLDDKSDSAESNNGLDEAHEMLNKLYDPEIAEQYIREHEEYAAQVISPFIEDMTYEEILQKIRQDGAERPKQRIVITKNLTEEKAELIKQALEDAHVQGFKCESVWRRVYVAPQCLTHVLGYVGQVTEGSPLLTGISGLEKQLDRYLLGQNGIRESRRDSRGKIIPSKEDRFKPAVNGLNVRLTVNMEAQTIVEEELDKGLEHYHAPRGTIIVVEPKTGNIMAMASRPQFNLNTKENMQEGALNYAVQGLYEPGSTFKIVSVTSAVDTGKATFDTMISCSPVPVPGARPVNDAPRSYGGLSVAGVLKKSSNPGAFNIARRAGGWSVYKNYLKAYGFRDKTGVELPSESKGQSQDGANYVNFSRMTYGYSIMTTPLHMAMAYAAIANDGVLMKPRLVEEICDSNGVIVERRPPQMVRRVMKSSISRDMRIALEGVAAPDGTAKRGNVPGYAIGGKTGTAHKVKEKGGGYYEGRYTVSFCGLLPARNPAFICMVVIDDPHPTDCKAGGGTVCAPIFKNVATRLAAALHIPENGFTSELVTATEEQKPEDDNKKDQPKKEKKSTSLTSKKSRSTTAKASSKKLKASSSKNKNSTKSTGRKSRPTPSRQ